MQKWLTRRGMFVGCVLGLATSAQAAIPATWLAPISGAWTEAANWSTAPHYPDNGQPPGVDYDVTLAAAGTFHSVSLSTDITVSSLRLDSLLALLDQSAGDVTVLGPVAVDAGFYRLSGGSLHVGGSLTSGASGRFVWTGGSLRVDGPLDFGSAGVTGLTTLSGNQTLQAAGPITISQGGGLTLSSPDSAVSAAGLSFALNGTFALQSGTLDLSAGSFLPNGDDVRLVSGAGGSGFVSLRNDAWIYVNLPGQRLRLAAGVDSTAGMRLDGHSSVVSHQFYVADAPGAVATLTMNESSSVTSQLWVGNVGQGTVVQNGGTLAGGDLLIGYSAGGRGTYILNDGTILVRPSVAHDGSGTFVQNGGRVQTYQLDVGGRGGGVYRMNGGVTAITYGVYAPQLSDSTGTLELAGGTLSFTGMYIGAGRGSSGVVRISGGRLSGAAIRTGAFNFGFQGINGEFLGRFEQTGGVVTTSKAYAGDEPSFAGSLAFARGTISLSGGSFTADYLALGQPIAGGGEGTLIVSGSAAVRAGELRVTQNGTAMFEGGRDVRATNVIVDAGGRVRFAPGAGAALQYSYIDVDGGGSFDLADGVLLQFGPAVSSLAAGLLRNGYSGGAWDGTGGVRSSIAAGSGGTLSLGFAPRSVAASDERFRGIDLPTDTSLIIALTVSGDANLDSTVDNADFASLAANFGRFSVLWDGGNFNFDGRIDLGDFSILAANFNRSLQFAGRTAIPEPTAGAAVLAVTALSRRRSRTPGVASRGSGR